MSVIPSNINPYIYKCVYTRNGRARDAASKCVWKSHENRILCKYHVFFFFPRTGGDPRITHAIRAFRSPDKFDRPRRLIYIYPACAVGGMSRVIVCVLYMRTPCILSQDTRCTWVYFEANLIRINLCVCVCACCVMHV